MKVGVTVQTEINPTPRCSLFQSLMLSATSEKATGPIFKVFGMTRPGFEPRPPGWKADAQPIELTICQKDRLPEGQEATLAAILLTKLSLASLIVLVQLLRAEM